MTDKRLLSLDEVFAEDLKNEEFQKQLRLQKPYSELLIEVINRRTELGMTQKELAETAHTHQSRISKIESGQHDFRISTIIQIAEALKSEVIIRLLPLEVKCGDEFSDWAEKNILSISDQSTSDQDAQEAIVYSAPVSTLEYPSLVKSVQYMQRFTPDNAKATEV